MGDTRRRSDPEPRWEKPSPPAQRCRRTSGWALGAHQPGPAPTLLGHVLTGASSSVRSGSTASEDRRAGSLRSWSRCPSRMNLSFSLPVQGSSRVLYTTLPAVLRLSKMDTWKTKEQNRQNSQKNAKLLLLSFFSEKTQKGSSELSNNLETQIRMSSTKHLQETQVFPTKEIMVTFYGDFSEASIKS